MFIFCESFYSFMITISSTFTTRFKYDENGLNHVACLQVTFTIAFNTKQLQLYNISNAGKHQLLLVSSHSRYVLCCGCQESSKKSLQVVRVGFSFCRYRTAIKVVHSGVLPGCTHRNFTSVSLLYLWFVVAKKHCRHLQNDLLLFLLTCPYLGVVLPLFLQRI